MPPGAKFGLIGSSRALTNREFIEQVCDSGSSNNQVNIAQRLEKGYHGKLLAKLRKGTAQVSVSAERVDEEWLMMPAMKDIRVADRMNDNFGIDLSDNLRRRNDMS